MTQLRLTILAAVGGLVMLGLTGAQQPPAFAGASPGEWELAGVPGAKAPIRQCVSDLAMLAQFEHRSQHCTSSVLSDHGNSTVIQYNCGAAGFGRTQIDVLTPRSLRISTQGISDSLPFNYVLQARRMGDCEKSASSSRH